jgi:hypothetical protein
MNDDISPTTPPPLDPCPELRKDWVTKPGEKPAKPPMNTPDPLGTLQTQDAQGDGG